MCKTESTALLSSLLVTEAAMIAPHEPVRPTGSRRRRLWELDTHAHCPVLGVCLPIAVLRRLVNKVLAGEALGDDYEVHCGAVADSRYRSPIAEAVQRELERRYAAVIKQAARCKTTAALSDWWNGALRSHEIAGPLWATLTHACCTPELAKQVEGAVHMLQHQAGMAARVDITRFSAVLDENAVLTRELAAAQHRSTRQATDQARRIEEQQGQIMRLRADVLNRDTQLAAVRDDLQALEAAVPALRARADLARECELLIERRNELQRLLLQAQQEAERQQRRAEELARQLERRDAAPLEAAAAAGEPDAEALAVMSGRAILCVGGRTGSVPVYRQLVEDAGARFLHHDGGQETNTARLDDTLAAEDLVICQAGCISHDAYWRVKDHCKRTGKKCVFTESPSSAGLKRALIALVTSTPMPQPAVLN